ncbi:MAG: hypothetical protein GX987_10110 [Tissierellia bacterium]|nr:hypothetical protein [Tissierellia bacterium]
MFVPHKYAFQIEITMKSVFKCGKSGFGGIADADFIEKQPFVAIASVLGNFYNKLDSNTKNKVDKFIQDYYLEIGKSMEEIGEETIKNITKQFNNIISTI